MLSSSASFPEKELIHSSKALIFATVAQESPPDHSSRGLYISVCFKSCCLKVWLPILPESRCWLTYAPSKQGWVLTYTQLLGMIKNKIGCMDSHKGWRDNEKLEMGWTIRFISTQGHSFKTERGVYFIYYIETNKKTQVKWMNWGICPKWRNKIKIYETEISNLVDKQFNNGHKKCA